MSEIVRTLPARLDIVIPAYNEQECIGEMIDALHQGFQVLGDAIALRVIVANDGSRDRTEAIVAEKARTHNVLCVSLTRNFGHQAALTAGLDHADGDAVIMMDGDFQHPIETAIDMVRAWLGGAKVVLGQRNMKGKLPLMKRVTSDGFYQLFNMLSETKLVTGVPDFCLLDQAVLKVMQSLPERHRFLRGLVAWSGYELTVLPFPVTDRRAGSSKYGMRKMVQLALDALFSFTTSPMRVMSRLGLASILGGLFYFVYVMARYFFVGDLIQGWASVVVLVLVLGGIQLVFMGVMGAYVARTYEEAKGRPLYVIDKVIEGSTKSS